MPTKAYSKATHGKATVKIHDQPNKDNLKKATEQFLKKVELSKQRAKK